MHCFSGHSVTDLHVYKVMLAILHPINCDLSVLCPGADPLRLCVTLACPSESCTTPPRVSLFSGLVSYLVLPAPEPVVITLSTAAAPPGASPSTAASQRVVARPSIRCAFSPLSSLVPSRPLFSLWVNITSTLAHIPSEQNIQTDSAPRSPSSPPSPPEFGPGLKLVVLSNVDRATPKRGSAFDAVYTEGIGSYKSSW
jgi:hypothetical protein